MRIWPLLACLGGCGRVNFDEAVILPPACPSDSSLLACWDFEGDVVDRTGRGNDGTPSDVSYVPGIDGLAVQTTLTSRIDIVIPNLVTTQITVDAWIRPEPTTLIKIVIDHESRWGLYVEPDGTIGVAFARSEFIVSSSWAVPNDRWSHIAFTFDGASLVVLIDGVVAGSLAATPFDQTNDFAAIAGNSPPSDFQAPYVGAIDRVRVWNTVLTTEQLCALGAGC